MWKTLIETVLSRSWLEEKPTLLFISKNVVEPFCFHVKEQELEVQPRWIPCARDRLMLSMKVCRVLANSPTFHNLFTSSRDVLGLRSSSILRKPFPASVAGACRCGRTLSQVLCLMHTLVCGHHGQRGGWQSSALCPAGIFSSCLGSCHQLRTSDPGCYSPQLPFPAGYLKIRSVVRIGTEMEAVITDSLS